MNNRTLSLVLGIIIIFLIGIGGYYLGVSKKNTRQFIQEVKNQKISQQQHNIRISSMVSTVPTTPISFSPSSSLQSVSQVVSAFYNWYTTCSGTCDYTVSEFIDKNRLTQNITKKSSNGINAIICAQNPPQSLRVDNITSEHNTETAATLIESFDTGNEIPITVVLQLENNAWKIVDITCPQQ